MKVIQRGSVMLALLMVVGGCQAIDVATGKDRLQRDFDRERNESDSEIRLREDRIRELEEERLNLLAELEVLRTQYTEAQKELGTLRAERSAAAINVLLFRGDITYAVVPAAFGDYRAGLRLLALRDSTFGESLQQFEKLDGGDASVLRVLQQIDANEDRTIGLEEARNFRGQQEGSLKQAE